MSTKQKALSEVLDALIATGVISSDEDTSEAYDLALKALEGEFGETILKTKELPSIVNSLEKARLKASQISSHELTGLGITKFKNLTNKLDGFQPGLYTIAAGANIGKTAFTISMLASLVIDRLNNLHDYNILYISADDPDVYGAQRFVSAYTGFPIHKVKKFADASPVDKDVINKAYELVSEMDKKGYLKIVDQKHFDTIDDIDGYVKAMKDISENMIMFIDGSYNVDPDKHSRPIREQNIKRFTKLKKICDVQKITCIITGELTKDKGECDSKNPPTKADLMETGKLEYHSAVILLLYPENYQDYVSSFERGSFTGVLRLRVAKNKRSSYKGTLYLNIDLRTAQITEGTEYDKI